MKMNLVEASSPEELLGRLRDNDVRVPARSQGRVTAHSEIWIACRFFSALAETSLIHYPLRLVHRDRPDFVLCSPQFRTGIEITEAVPEDKARVDVHSERDGRPVIRPVPFYRPGDSRRSQVEIRRVVDGQEPPMPIMGNAIERNWVEVMLHYTELKHGRFKNPDFDKHQHNWLLIYDNWPLGSSLDERGAAGMLAPKLCSIGQENFFDRIFVQRPDDVWEFNNGNGPVTHRIPVM